MEFNSDKCHVLWVTRKQNPIIHDYTLHGKVLETVDSAKYLGVTINRDLRWNHHVEIIAYKANRSLGFLRRNLRINSSNLKSLAHKTSDDAGKPIKAAVRMNLNELDSLPLTKH